MPTLAPNGVILKFVVPQRAFADQSMHALLAAGRILLLLVAAPASTEDAVGDFAAGESRDLGSGDASSGSTGGAGTYSERELDFFAGGGQDTAEAPLT